VIHPPATLGSRNFSFVQQPHNIAQSTSQGMLKKIHEKALYSLPNFCYF